MERYSGPLIVIAFGLGFLLLVVVNFGPFANGPGRPTELLPADDMASIPIDDRDAPGLTYAEDADPPPPLHDRAWGLHMARLYAHFFGEDAGSDRPSDVRKLAPLDLSALTPAHLQQLDGQRIQLRVVADSGVWRVGDRDVFEAVMKDADDLATVWLYANPDVEDGMTVEGRLRVVRHATILVGVTMVKAFMEYGVVEVIRR